MVATVADLRDRPFAEVAYLFVPDGLPYAWVTDHDFRNASLLGSGVGTWADTLPTSVGPRTILRGLQVPELRESLDIKTLSLEPSQVTFKLTDYDGVLATLFATEGKDVDTLSEPVAPGTAALGASITIQGGATVNPRGRHIGLERIGPAGERGYFSCFPWTAIGPQHPVNVFGPKDEGPPPIPISVDPVVFAGRRCALYLLYKDPNAVGALSWPDLQEQYDAGGLLWWGKLADKGTIEANRVWSLVVDGPESLLRKTLNQLSFGWKPVSDVVTVLSAEERFVGIEYLTTNLTTSELETRNSLGFTHAASTLTAAGDKATWISELNTLLEDVGDGSTTDYGTNNFQDYNDARVRFANDGAAYIHRPIQLGETTGSDIGAVGCNIVLHEKVWRKLGFDPPLQATDGNAGAFTDETQSVWVKITQGANVSVHSFPDGGDSPAESYWRLYLHAGRLGYPTSAFPPLRQEMPSPGTSYVINDGAKRYFRPLLAGDVMIIPQVIPDGGLDVRLSIDQPYIEGQPTVPRRNDSAVGLNAVEQARYFVFRGKRQPAKVTTQGGVFQDGQPVKPADVESEDEVQVVRLAWDTNGGVGTVRLNSDFPTFVMERWMDPRVFGVNRGPVQGEWAAMQDGSQEFKIECAPLATYGAGFADDAGKPTPSHQVFFQLMLSTGTATGWDAGEETLTDFAEGTNTHPGQATDWCIDSERWDMGLAIPYQLVQEPDDAVLAFDALPSGRDSGFNRSAFAFVGPYESMDVLTSILQPRGLAMTLRGNRYSLVHLGLFDPADADVVITQDSLWGDQNDPTTTHPRQKLRACGQLDVLKLHYRGDPVEGGPQKEIQFRAKDNGALYRNGDLELNFTDLGIGPVWGYDGIPDWSGDAREFWSKTMAAFYDRRHFLLQNVVLSRVAGQDVRVGSQVRLTNPWPVNPGGGYGITDAIGHVVDWRWNPDRTSPEVDILCYADQFDGLRVFMPIGKFQAGSDGWGGGATVTLETDFLGHGEGVDASRFEEPDWSGGIGEMRVRILSTNRRTWSLSAVYTVASVAGNVVTLTGTPTDILRDTDKYLIAAEWDQQTTAQWPYSRGSVLVLDTHRFGAGSTKGWPLIP